MYVRTKSHFRGFAGYVHTRSRQIFSFVWRYVSAARGRTEGDQQARDKHHAESRHGSLSDGESSQETKRTIGLRAHLVTVRSDSCSRSSSAQDGPTE